MLHTYGLLRYNVEGVAETSKHVTDVLPHYPSNGNWEYLHHHHVTVMRLHPAEPFLLGVMKSSYLPTVTRTNFDSNKELDELIDLLRT